MHRGSLLGHAVKSSGIPVKHLMSVMHLSRTTFYNHMKDRDLPLETLNAYGRAMDYDFSRDLSDPAEAEAILAIAPLTLEEAMRQTEAWRSRYYAKVEEFHTYLDGLFTVNLPPKQ